VRKGEKGIVILAPLIGKKKSEDDGESEEKRLFGFRAAYVFDGLSRDFQDSALGCANTESVRALYCSGG
jgi:hypothetical protein